MKYIKLFEQQTTQEYSIYDIIIMTPDDAGKVVFDEIWGKNTTPNLEFIKTVFELSSITPNYKNHNGHTLLMLASYFGHVEIVEWLLEFPEINVNITSNRNQTALILACSKVNDNKPNIEKIIEMLLERPEINVDIKDNMGYTAWQFVTPDIKEKFPELKPHEL